MFLRIVAEIGEEIGMALHVGKTQLLSIRTTETIVAPGEVTLANRASMVYFGGLA